MNILEDTYILPLLSDITWLDPETAVDALGGSAALYKSVLNQFILLLPSRVEKMERFFEAGDGLPGFAAEMHGIKGVLKQIGCYELAEVAARLEKAAKHNDAATCEQIYTSFKDSLLIFGGQLNLAKTSFDAKPRCEINSASVQSIKDHLKTLIRAKDSAEDYDCLQASEYLAPLKNLCFNERTEQLLSDAIDKFEGFNRKGALESLTMLIDLCNFD